MSYRRRSSSSNHRFCVMWAFRLFPWGKARLLCRPTAADAKRHRLWSMNTTAVVYVFSVCRNNSTRVPLLHLNKTTSGKLLAEQLAVNCNSPRGRGSLLDQYVVYYHRRWHSPSLSIDVQSVPHLSWSLSPSVPSTGRWEEWALAVFPFNSFDWIPEKERRESGRDLVCWASFSILFWTMRNVSFASYCRWMACVESKSELVDDPTALSSSLDDKRLNQVELCANTRARPTYIRIVIAIGPQS